LTYNPRQPITPPPLKKKLTNTQLSTNPLSTKTLSTKTLSTKNIIIIFAV